MSEENRIALFIKEYEELGRELLGRYEGNLKAAQHAIKNHYIGCFESVGHYAEEVCAVDIPEKVRPYIHWVKMGCDMEAQGEIFIVEEAYKVIHIFEAY